MADGKLHGLIDEAGIKNKDKEIEDETIVLDNIQVPNFLGEVTKQQDTMKKELKKIELPEFLAEQLQSAGADPNERDFTPEADALFTRQIHRINEYLSLIQKWAKLTQREEEDSS